ncbi:MAG TPA: serine/threonine-protein kinase, partial [Polyangia bacterium]
MDELPPLGGPGQRLGRYGLLQRIAVGGMAEVYRAWAEGPGDFRKLVAIKRLLPQHALDPQLLRMFLDESRLMARFGHPNLPQVIDVSDGGGVDVPFFVMEHVSGVDLREILRAAGGALPVEHIVTIATGVAAGLHHAHELRADDGRPLDIVHRDVSPSNVLVSFDGTVKVTDFGVAKWLQQKSFTYQGQLKGKFAHMSPEQCRGEALDRRSDVFALGTLLYEMATGRPPFEADTELELLSKIASQDAAWPGSPTGATKAELPESFGAIIMRALRRNRADRFATTREMQLAIEGWAREEKVVASAVGLGAYVEALFADRLAELRAVPLATRADGAVDGPDGGGLTGLERTATDAFAVDGGPSAASGGATEAPARSSTEPPREKADGGVALPASVPASVPQTATAAVRARRGGARHRVLGLAALGLAAALAIAVQQLTLSNDAPAFEPAT